MPDISSTLLHTSQQRHDRRQTTHHQQPRRQCHSRWTCWWDWAACRQVPRWRDRTTCGQVPRWQRRQHRGDGRRRQLVGARSAVRRRHDRMSTINDDYRRRRFLRHRRSQMITGIMLMMTVMTITTNLAPRLTAGCCHLANLMTWSQ